MISYSERVYWNNQRAEELGEWRIIPKRFLQAAFILICLITPGTNWAIPFIVPKIKEVKY